MESVGGMKFRKRENPEKNPKIPILPTTDPLAVPRLELGTPVYCQLTVEGKDFVGELQYILKSTGLCNTSSVTRL